MELKIYRLETSDEGTFGILCVDGKAFCCTLELPWKDNEKNISCIPAGVYPCQGKKSPKFGMVPEVLNVPGRSDILIHPGNVLADIQGCIMVGHRFGILDKKRALFDSRIAMEDFRKLFASAKSLKLEVVWVCTPPGLQK